MESDGELNGAICSKCSYAYPDVQEIGTEIPQDRTPYPACGSTGINFQVNVASIAIIRTMLGLKSKRQGAKKPKVVNKLGQFLWMEGRMYGCCD